MRCGERFFLKIILKTYGGGFPPSVLVDLEDLGSTG